MSILIPWFVVVGPSQRFQASDFPSELEEETGECPVNYSLQDSEGEEPRKQPKPPTSPVMEEVTTRTSASTPPVTASPGFFGADSSRTSAVPTASPALFVQTAPGCLLPPTVSPVVYAQATSSLPPPSVSPGLYAETDLDQPTDFSLKYGEETSSDEDLGTQGYVKTHLSIYSTEKWKINLVAVCNLTIIYCALSHSCTLLCSIFSVMVSTIVIRMIWKTLLAHITRRVLLTKARPTTSPALPPCLTSG